MTSGWWGLLSIISLKVFSSFLEDTVTRNTALHDCEFHQKQQLVDLLFKTILSVYNQPTNQPTNFSLFCFGLDTLLQQ